MDEGADRLKQLGVTIRPHTAWLLNGCRDLFGHDYPGRIPGELVIAKGATDRPSVQRLLTLQRSAGPRSATGRPTGTRSGRSCSFGQTYPIHSPLPIWRP